MLQVSKKRKSNIALCTHTTTAVTTTAEKSARQVEQYLLLSCDDKFAIHVSPKVCQLLSSMIFINSLNIARINMKLLPAHNLTLTSHVVSNVTHIPMVISNIVVMFLSDDHIRIDPNTCGDCMFPLHKRYEGLSVNCKSSTTCIVCMFDIVSSSLAISLHTCEVCNGFIAHEDCIDHIQTNTCFKCTPREKRVNCVGCRYITCKAIRSSSKCTICKSYLCKTCQKKSKCGSCFALTCYDCITRCLECDEGFCATCWNDETFNCSVCSDKPLCRECSIINASCNVCHLTTSTCVLCSTFTTCGICDRRICGDCECSCKCDDYENNFEYF